MEGRWFAGVEVHNVESWESEFVVVFRVYVEVLVWLGFCGDWK